VLLRQDAVNLFVVEMKKTNENYGQRPHRTSGSREHAFDSSGPEGRVRGTAKQLFEKYIAFGHDSLSAGDWVTAESFFQHAEHYRRVLLEKEEKSGSASPNADAFPPKKRNFLPQQRQSRGEGVSSPKAPKPANMSETDAGDS
jgi:Domain of unknown function (DUF4167)